MTIIFREQNKSLIDKYARYCFCFSLLIVLLFLFIFITACEEKPKHDQKNKKFTHPYEIISSQEATKGDRFGCSLAANDEYLIAGAECALSLDEEPCPGAAYIFRIGEDQTWNHGAQILPADSELIERFGTSVAIEDNNAIVGSIGQAFVFNRTGNNEWELQAALSIDDGTAPDDFGLAVAIDGEHALVGAPAIGSNDSKTGTAYLFQKSEDGDWVQVKQFIPFNSSADDQFGASVALDGDYAVIGAPESGVDNGGAVFVYYRSSLDKWDVETSLHSSNTKDKSEFGTAVAIDGSYLIVGDMEHFTTNKGEAYIYYRTAVNTWTDGKSLKATLTSPSIPYDGYEYGRAAAIHGKYGIVGSPKMARGAAFVFNRTNKNKWSHGRKIRAFGADEAESFGYSVAINSKFAFVGAPGSAGGGAIYIYK